MQYSDNNDQHKADANTVFDHAEKVGNVIITGTEAGGNSGNLPTCLQNAAESHNWWLYRHGSGEWVAFDKAWASHVAHDWIGPVIPSRGGTGGHAARGIAWFTANPKSGPQTTVGVCHFLTANSLETEPDPNANKKLQAAALDFCKDKSKGDAIVIINGDVNMSDKAKNVWGSADIVTSWDELKKWPDTHEGGPANAIDVISRYKPDGGKFTAGEALPDSKVKMYSDHLIIQATLKV